MTCDGFYAWQCSVIFSWSPATLDVFNHILTVFTENSCNYVKNAPNKGRTGFIEIFLHRTSSHSHNVVFLFSYQKVPSVYPPPPLPLPKDLCSQSVTLRTQPELDKQGFGNGAQRVRFLQSCQQQKKGKIKLDDRIDTQTRTWSQFYVPSGCSNVQMQDHTSTDDSQQSQLSALNLISLKSFWSR